jgi:TRAP-type C4-dicarboxylate transport system substrate-binding protein
LNFEGLTVNLDAWNKLSAQDQKAIEALASQVEPEFWEAPQAEDNRNFILLKAWGMETYTPLAAVRNAMAAKGKPNWPAFGDTVPAVKQLLRLTGSPFIGLRSIKWQKF